MFGGLFFVLFLLTIVQVPTRFELCLAHTTTFMPMLDATTKTQIWTFFLVLCWKLKYQVVKTTTKAHGLSLEP